MKLHFKPFTETEANKLISTPPKALVATLNKFKVSKWLDSKSREILYGIRGKNKNSSWYDLSSNNRALIFDNKKLANKVCKEFNKLTLTK